MVRGVDRDVSLGGDIDLNDFLLAIHGTCPVVCLVGILSTAQLHDAEQVVDVALILQSEVEVISPVADHHIDAGNDCVVASL